MHTSETSSVVRRFAIDLVILLTCLAANLMGGGSPAAEVTTPEAVAAELGYDLAQPLSIHQCIQIALRVHPDIRVAVAELEQATASLQQARAALWPAFTGSIDYRVTDQPTRTAVVGGSLIPVGGGRSTARNAQISGYYSLYESGRFQTIRRARAYRDAAVAGLEDAKRRLAYLVTQAYFDRLVAERLVAVKEASILAAQEHVNQVQARINAGEAAPVEIHAVRAQLHAAQLDLSSARTQAAIAHASLRVALGDPQTEVILIDAWREPVSLPQLDELIETALQNRSDVVSQEAIVRAARLGVKLAQLQRRPRFNVVGTAEYGRHNSSSGPAWSIYGGIEQTLFDGGATKAALRQAQAECVAAEAQLESLKRNVALEVESSWLRLRQSAEAIAAAEAASAEAHAALRAAETRYAANVGILLEITDAQLRADEADVNVVSAYYDYNIALADLERAIGLRTIQEQP